MAKPKAKDLDCGLKDQGHGQGLISVILRCYRSHACHTYGIESDSAECGGDIVLVALVWLAVCGPRWVVL